MADRNALSPWNDETWLGRHAASLSGHSPEVQFDESEKRFFDGLFDSAELIGFGEMTHGSSEVFALKDRLARFLIEHRSVSVIVLESNLAATRAVNDYVLGADIDPAVALSATGYFSCANAETLSLVQWIRQFNDRQRHDHDKVKIFGCDIQSIDDAKVELQRQLRQHAQRKVLSNSELDAARQALSRLPNDRQLSENIGLIFEQLDAENTDLQRLTELQNDQSDLIKAVEGDVHAVVGKLSEIRAQLCGDLGTEEAFYFERCATSLTQSLDHFRFQRGGTARDRHMADNVLAVHEHFSGQRAFAVSGNWHLSRVPIEFEGADDYVTMGSHIADQLGDKYCVLSTAFHHGAFLGMTNDSPESEVIVQTHEPQIDTLEYWLNEYACDQSWQAFAIDFRRHRKQHDDPPWSRDLMMNIGEAGGARSYEATFVPQRPDKQYDATAFLTKTTPLRVLAEYYDFWQSRTDSI